MDERSRQRSLQGGYHFNPSPSASTSMSSTAASTDQLARTAAPQLRPLPGYGSAPAADFLASHVEPLARSTPPLGTIASQQSPKPQTPVSAAPSTKPYQSRERLYYQQEPAAPSQAPGSTGGAAKPSFAAYGSPLSGYDRPLSAAEAELEAPPTGSLYDEPLSPERAYQQPHAAIAMPAAVLGSPMRPPIDMLSGSLAAVAPSRINTQADLGTQVGAPSTEPIDSWVTVFGFTGAQTAPVLAYFKTVGSVVKTELGQRNWLHIQFDSPWSAQKALLKNGSVLPSAGSCMIGVIPTRSAMDQVGLASTSFMSPLKKSEMATSPFAGPLGAASTLGSRQPTEQQHNPPQTPGFPQTSMYSNAVQPSGAALSAPAQPTSIFAKDSARARTEDMTAAAASGQDGLLTKTFNYLFGF